MHAEKVFTNTNKEATLQVRVKSDPQPDEAVWTRYSNNDPTNVAQTWTNTAEVSGAHHAITYIKEDQYDISLRLFIADTSFYGVYKCEVSNGVGLQLSANVTVQPPGISIRN